DSLDRTAEPIAESTSFPFPPRPAPILRGLHIGDFVRPVDVRYLPGSPSQQQYPRPLSFSEECQFVDKTQFLATVKHAEQRCRQEHRQEFHEVLSAVALLARPANSQYSVLVPEQVAVQHVLDDSFDDLRGHTGEDRDFPKPVPPFVASDSTLLKDEGHELLG